MPPSGSKSLSTDKVKGGPQLSRLATEPLPARQYPTIYNGGRNQRWPTSGPVGYKFPSGCKVSKSEIGGQNERWPTSIHNPCCLGCPQRFGVGDKS